MSRPPPPARPLRRAAPLRALLAPSALPALVAAASCLPREELPRPGIATFYLTAEPAREAREPVATADGWALTFDRVLVAFQGFAGTSGPDVGVDYDECEAYYDTYRSVLYDVLEPGRKPLGRYAALGACAVAFTWGLYDGNFRVLGPGVTDDDARLMLLPRGADPYAESHDLLVAGSATRGDRRVTFAWTYGDSYPVRWVWPCPDGPQRTYFVGLDLASGDDVEVTLRVRPERLFFDRFDEARAALRFDPVAGADANGDGEVTLDELGAVDLARLATPDGAYELPYKPRPPDAPPLPDDERPPPVFFRSYIEEQARRVLYEGDRNLCGLL